MDMTYIIGVDGGGTKADYILFNMQGELIDALHLGTRSHECVDGGFEEVEELMLQDMEYLLKKNHIEKHQIVAAAFGLAGIDTPAQLKEIKRIVDKMHLPKYVISNDSILGIKAGSDSGVGICSINGTGTVASGINEAGEILQVGGIGMATGDSAGGGYIATLAIKAVYDFYFRCGDKTSIAEEIMKLFEIKETEELLNVISEKFHNSREYDKEIVTILFHAANNGDQVAQNIVKNTANELAKSVSGCIRHLKFTHIPEVILAGSIWTKASCPLLMECFKTYIYEYTGFMVNPKPLQVIPAAGAIIWAMEIAHNRPLTLEERNVILHSIQVLS